MCFASSRRSAACIAIMDSRTRLEVVSVQTPKVGLDRAPTLSMIVTKGHGIVTLCGRRRPRGAA
jgi:hypothetical protein